MVADKEVSVIGAGLMGIEIAILFSRFGYKVILIDKDNKDLNKIRQMTKSKTLAVNIMMKFSYKIDEVMSRISYSTKIKDIGNSFFIIESINENLEEKIRIHKKIEEVISENAIIAINTSCIPIEKICKNTTHLNRTIGIHFMNPVNQIDTFEIVNHTGLDKEVFEKVKLILSSIDKNCLYVKDTVGFISNRISHLMINEAAKMVYEDIAEPETIDLIFEKCFGHKMGPLRTADLIGIDTVVNSLHVLYSENGRDEYNCSPLLENMIRKNHLGRKSKVGFYQY